MKSDTAWRETILLAIIGGILLVTISFPAFQSYFMGEDFIYLGQYRRAGNDYWRAVLSPTTSIFFRPAFSAINLLWQFVLPKDPFVHQMRNVAFSILNIALLDRVLVRLVKVAWARWLGVLFFAVSKIHLTALGYINVYDSIVSLTIILIAVLFFLRFAERRRPLDYVVGLAFTALGVFTKDYGLVIVAVITALVAFEILTPKRWQASWRGWAVRLAPLGLTILVYLALRYAIVGSLPAGDTVYRPELSPDVVLQKLLVFSSTLVNLSFADPWISGAGGIGSLFSDWGIASSVDWGLYVVLMALALLALVLGRGAGWALVFPIAWIGAYFGPTLLTRNIQMYYMYEPLAGVATLLAVCLARASRAWHVVWLAALVVIGANGVVSNRASLYVWQDVTNSTRRVMERLFDIPRARNADSITFLTAGGGYWAYALAADASGAMVAEMLGNSSLKVRFVNQSELVNTDEYWTTRNLIVDLDHGVTRVRQEQRATLAVELRPPTIRSINPNSVHAGQQFGVIVNGKSSLFVLVENPTTGTVVVLNGTPLVTWSSPDWLLAEVPGELYSQPGQAEVFIRNANGVSNTVSFVIDP